MLLSIAVSLALSLTQSKCQIVMLGTGTPRPDPERSGPASAIVVNGESYLIDCGPGIVRRASAANLTGIKALAARSLRRVFITHLHSDHTLGYPDLILSPWVVGRTAPLEAYGPHGLESMTNHILEAYGEDITVRTQGLEHGNTTGYKVHVTEVKPGVIYQDANVIVKAFLVKHGSWKEAFGFRFETSDRVVVFSGDTAPCESLVGAAKGADVLVHEVYEEAEAAPENRPGGSAWPRYLHEFHTSTVELGRIAAKAGVKELVLYHILRSKTTPDGQLIAEVRKGGFNGPVIVPRDLDVL